MAKKVHTRAKKKLRLATHKSYKIKTSNYVKHRPRTFKSEETATEYAKKKGITSFELKKVKKNKKFQIVEKQ